MNKLQIKHKTMSLRTMPPEALDDKMIKFGYWLQNILGLTGDTSADRLLVAIPAIKDLFWSLGFDEIEKAFTMYVDGKLKTQPITNYLDRILVGKIFKEYKEQQPIKKKETKMPEPTKEEKELIIYEGLIFCFDNWVQTKDIINGQLWVHDHLMELGLLKFTADEKKAMWNLALKVSLEKSKQLSYKEAKDVVKQLENKNSPIRINEYKRIRLKRYFSTIKHIKDVI